MKKISAAVLSVLILFSCLSGAVSAQAATYEPDVELYSEAYMLLNLDDDSCPVVAQKNQDEKLYPASLTKIVTAMVVLQNTQDTSEKVTVSQEAYDVLLGTGAQVAELSVGDELTVLDLLYLTMVYSACDACEVLAEYVGGTRDAFIEMMNEYVSSLGCESTHFTNPTGLHDENHYTTAADMAKITLEALKNETFEKISTTVQYEYDGMTYSNTNLMLLAGYVSYYYEYAAGIKTGSTDEAGYCVITKASKNGYNYLAVVMGAPVIDYNSDGYDEKCSFIDAASLFEWAFSSLKYTTLFENGEIVDEIAVENGKDADSVQLVTAEALNTIVPTSLDKSAIIIDVKDKPESLSAPVEAGDLVCTADIIYGDEVIATIDLIAANSVELSTFLKIINAIKAFFSLLIVKVILLAAVLLAVIYLLLVYKNYQKKKKRRQARANQPEERGGTDDLPPPKRR